MAITKEVIESILNFHPNGGESGRIDLGPVDEGISLVWGAFSYPTRFTAHPDEPLTTGRTTQPVLALVGESGSSVLPLPYRADIRRLPGPLIERVAERLHNYSLVPTK